jgi:hypothetical protein
MNEENKKYAFWIELADGQEVRWSNLTQTQATRMHAMTDKKLPLNIKAYGWEEQQ